ncbi:unnamed protein product [Darwinula stevensoni]|uniref:CARD domain-containing protein n=1 Tax=Darwinula stevensoni TaxID=69355 RepID=A0A7R9A5K5_9CRUS|nr:unnamed protein product [Darwinula stevensoni]CAG0894593.1 unnamed protein product [Darwinula stevensoni]
MQGRNGTPKTWDKIRQHRRRIRDDFNLDVDELLRFSSDKEVFTNNEEKIIRGVGDLSERFDKLFDILLTKNVDRIPLFLETLSAMGRNDIRMFLQGIVECHLYFSPLKGEGHFPFDPSARQRAVVILWRGDRHHSSDYFAVVKVVRGISKIETRWFRSPNVRPQEEKSPPKIYQEFMYKV